MKALIISFLIFVPTTVFGHSGGTDSKGCHAGTEPYHCHNKKDDSSVNIGAWDINVGYQYQIGQSNLISFLGASYGTSDHDLDSSFGANIGLKYNNGWYASYVSTSKSVQLGYGFFHISANSDYVGLGFRYPFSSSKGSKQSSSYFGGSVLLSGTE